jgi:hypothetical protein
MSKQQIACNSLHIPSWPKEMPLYKYLSKENADKFFNNGELSIGTLYGFRDEEKHGKRIGDKDEGKKEIYEHVDDTLISDPLNNQLTPFVKKYLSIGKDAKNVRIVNCDFVQEHYSKNLYIYCMCSEYKKELYVEFNANVCVRIKKPYKFIRAVSFLLQGKQKLENILSCKYGDRRQMYGQHDNIHPCIIKDNCYRNQKEVRAIWIPEDDKDIVPLIITLNTKYVHRYCEIFNTSY